MTKFEDLKLEIERLTSLLNNLSLEDIMSHRKELSSEFKKLSILILDYNSIFRAPRAHMEFKGISAAEITCREKILNFLAIAPDKYFSVIEICKFINTDKSYANKILNELRFVGRIESIKEGKKCFWKLADVNTPKLILNDELIKSIEENKW